MATLSPVFKCCYFKHEVSVNGSPSKNSSIDGSFTRHLYSCLVCVGAEVPIMCFHIFLLVLYRAFMKIENRQTTDPCFSDTGNHTIGIQSIIFLF